MTVPCKFLYGESLSHMVSKYILYNTGHTVAYWLRCIQYNPSLSPCISCLYLGHSQIKKKKKTHNTDFKWRPEPSFCSNRLKCLRIGCYKWTLWAYVYIFWSLTTSVRRNTLWCVQTSLRRDPALAEHAVSCSTANEPDEAPATPPTPRPREPEPRSPPRGQWSGLDSAHS